MHDDDHWYCYECGVLRPTQEHKDGCVYILDEKRLFQERTSVDKFVDALKNPITRETK